MKKSDEVVKSAIDKIDSARIAKQKEIEKELNDIIMGLAKIK
jgi:hypothetical protein